MRSRAVLACLILVGLTSCTAYKRCAYEGSGRDEWQKPDAVVEALGIRPGDRVADLGAGSGYFTARLARATGPTGRVYAVDVDADMLEYLRGRLAEEGVDNVEVVLGEYEDPKLPDGEIDLLFTSNTYHHIQGRVEYFRRVKADLVPGGRVAVIDFDGTRGFFVKLIGHYEGPEVVLEEMEEAGYTLVEDLDLSDRQSFLIFRAD